MEAGDAPRAREPETFLPGLGQDASGKKESPVMNLPEFLLILNTSDNPREPHGASPLHFVNLWKTSGSKPPSRCSCDIQLPA